MAYINGFFSKSSQKSPKEILENMRKPLIDSEIGINQFCESSIIKDRWGIEVYDYNWSAKKTIHTAGENDKVSIFLQGSFISENIESVARNYIQSNERFLDKSSIEGSFVFAIVDETISRVFLYSDFFGLEPIYYFHNNDTFAFSNSIKCLLTIPGIDKSVNIDTLNSFWNFGFPLLNQTPFKSINLLSQASYLSCDLNSFKLREESYNNLASIFNCGGNNLQVNKKNVLDAFQSSVLSRSLDASEIKLGLSLSGGLDSRAILGAMGEKANLLKTYTLGLPGCADEKLAERMAKEFGTDHAFIPINESSLNDFESLAKTFVSLSDGQYHPHESTEQVALDYLKSNPFDAMLRGHGGEIAKSSLAYPFQVNSSMMNMNTQEIIFNLFNKASLARQDIDLSKLLTKNITLYTQYSALDQFQIAAQPAIDAGINNIDIGLYLYISQWIRRQVVASLSLFRTKVEIRLPYLDKNFLSLLLKLPIEERWSGEFHRALIHQISPSLERIPDSNTGAPLYAGKTRVFVTDKLNSVLRRLSVKGFRHYTEFQNWQRKYFSEAIKEVLFSDQCLDRGFYSREELQSIYTLHLEGKGNYAHFLGTAIAIELLHRSYIDEEL